MWYKLHIGNIEKDGDLIPIFSDLGEYDFGEETEGILEIVAHLAKVQFLMKTSELNEKEEI